MTASRRHFVSSAASLAAAGWVPGLARAQAAWPAKPVHLHVTFAPGGVTDAAGRLLAEHLTRRFGQTVVVENRPGAAGNIGAGFVAKSEPDGYNLVLVLEGTIVFNPHLYDKMTYDPVKDLVPVGKVGDSTIVFVAHPSVGVKNLQEAIALSRTRSGGLSYATAGAMTITHIVGEMMKQRTNANFVHVPYRGGGPAVSDLLAGHVPLGFVSAASVHQHLRSGKLIALGVPSARRSPTLLDVPTFEEAGVTGFAANPWAGIFAPARTPQAVVERFNSELNALLSTPEVRDRLAGMGITATPIRLDQFAAEIRRELDAYGPMLKQANIRADSS